MDRYPYRGSKSSPSTNYNAMCAHLRLTWLLAACICMSTAARFLSQRTQGRRGGQLVSFETHKAVAEVRMSPWTATPIEASRVISVYHYAMCLKRLLLSGFYAGV